MLYEERQSLLEEVIGNEHICRVTGENSSGDWISYYLISDFLGLFVLMAKRSWRFVWAGDETETSSSSSLSSEDGGVRLEYDEDDELCGRRTGRCGSCTNE